METSVVRYVLVRESTLESHPSALLEALKQTVVGQHEALEAVVLGLVADGHVLLEGPPGVAKTLVCRALAAACGGSFQRIQFTPDLLPSDITGTRIFDQRIADFTTQLGPLFANVVLADEINRAPAKVQAALLEAMQERQVTIATESYALPNPSLVLATMNPYDSDGTYTLPFAQMDRFLMNVRMNYPSREEERRILREFPSQPYRAPAKESALPAEIISLEDIRTWRTSAQTILLPDDVQRYIIELAFATRPHETLPSDLRPYVHAGAGPRATLALAKCARAKAFLETRTHANFHDIQSIAANILRHRIVLTYRAQRENIDVEDITRRIIASVRP